MLCCMLSLLGGTFSGMCPRPMPRDLALIENTNLPVYRGRGATTGGTTAQTTAVDVVGHPQAGMLPAVAASARGTFFLMFA